MYSRMWGNALVLVCIFSVVFLKFCFGIVYLCISGYPQNCYVAEAGFKLVMPLPPPPWC